MIRDSVITLIAESKAAHGVHDSATETSREVFCQVYSVTRSEFYAALNIGVRPELIFKLSVREEYQEERLASFEGTRYEIIRSYETNDGGVELTVRRVDAR